MKPNFALQFLNDSISLLHRTARGWLEIGSTPIDAPDLADALGYLRRSALGLAPHGVATKLVIPEDQILYLQLSAPGPTDSHRDMQIRAALEGRTPYDVDDLVFDWSGNGHVVQVAVVARETLREAEAFALEYRLNPASFVALPDPTRFDGEPWFGPTEHAANLLQEGEIVERDAEAINIVSRDPQHREPRQAALPVEAPPEPIVEVPPVAEPAPIAEAPAPDPEPALTDEPALAAQIPAERVEAEAAPVPALPEPEPIAPEPLIDELPEPEAPEPEAPAPEPVRPEIPLPLAEPPAEPLPEIEPDLPEPEIPAGPEFVPAPEAEPEIEPWEEPWEGATLLPLDPIPDEEVEPTPLPLAAEAQAVSVIAPTIAEDVPPPPPGPAFASRRTADDHPAHRSGPARRLPTAPLTPPALAASAALARSYDPGAASDGEVPPPVAPAFRQALAASRAKLEGAPAPEPPVARPPRTAKSAGPVTAPGITGPGARAGRSSRSGKAPKRVDVQEVAQTLVAPPPEADSFRHARPASRGRPRYLGLILMGLLLLALAGVAAWSSIALSRRSTTDATAVADAPLDSTEPVASAEDIPPAEDEALADGQLPAPEPSPAADVADDTVQPEAADTAASTPLTTPEAQDEIIVSTQDAPPQPTDALSLETTEVAADALPGAPMPPPPFGTLYEFDADGLIKPTPEGIVTPEGVRLVAGRPALVPPPRPESIAARAAPVAPAPTPDAAAEGAVRVEPYTDPATQGLRPRPRPEGLAPAAEDAAAPAEAEGTRVVSLVPRSRPASIVKMAEQMRLDDEARKVAEAASLSAAAAAEALATAAPTPPTQAALQATGPVPGGLGISRIPPDKPRNFDRRVQAALAAALVTAAKPTQVAAAQPAPEPKKAVAQPTTAEPGADEEPDQGTVALRSSNTSSVAKNATFANAINLGRTNLIGVYGTPSRRYALIRTGSGSYKKVRVGDSLDGGKVAAITDSEVRYQKGGRMVALSMPKG
jgi:hypothetical protein